MRMTRCVLLLLVACGPAGLKHPPTSTEAPDLAPLPPDSSSGIGLLRERAAELALDADQQAQLEALDQELEDVNQPLEDQIDVLTRAPGPTPQARSGRGAGRRHGGGGSGVSLSRNGQSAQPSAPPSGNTAKPPPTDEEKKKQDELQEQERRIRQKILDNDAAYLERAFGLLRPDQRKPAMELLRQHGYSSKGQ